MKNIVTALLSFAFCLIKWQQAVAQKNTGNEGLIRGLFEAINRHDSLAVANFFDDSARLESPNWQGQEKGKQGVTTIYSRYFKGTPDIRFIITNMVEGDGAVVVEYTFGGKFSNPEPGTPAYMNNKTYLLKAATRYNISHNKIVYAVSYFDQVDFLRQVGYTFP